MKQSTKHILFFFFISISGYSQKVDERHITEPNPERFLPDFIDIDKVKSSKTTNYIANSKGKFLRASSNAPSGFVDEYPYKYIYSINSIGDTLSKFIYKYYKFEGILEYAELHDYSSNKSTYLYYDKDETINKKEFFWNNELISTTNWFYNKRRNFTQLIRVSIISQDIQKKQFRSFFHYLYDNDNKLVEKITILNDEITEIVKWKYDGDLYYQIGGGSKCGIYSPIEYFNEEYKYKFDKQGNWVKKISEYKNSENKKELSITEREIIYK